MGKTGLTTGSLGTRASGSQNPFYSLLCAFKIKEGVDSKNVIDMENAIINFLSQSYLRISHNTLGGFSEWFYIIPLEMRLLVHNFLYDNFNQYMHCYYYSERSIGVIYSWENKQLLEGVSPTPYRANDLSSPPIDPNCFMPGGCDADCDCWD